MRQLTEEECQVLREGGKPGIDLSNCQVNFAQAGIPEWNIEAGIPVPNFLNLSGGDLRGAEIHLSHPVCLDGANLEGATVVGEMGGEGSSFRGANLTGATLIGDFRLVSFKDANLNRVVITNPPTRRISQFLVCDFSGCQMDRVTLRNAVFNIACVFTDSQAEVLFVDGYVGTMCNLEGIWLMPIRGEGIREHQNLFFYHPTRWKI